MMGFKETYPDGLGIGGSNQGTVIPQFTHLNRGGKETAIELFSDDALDTVGKAIARNLILDARKLRKAGG
ncbi:MAG: hypothetical protein JRC86_04815 [Deltaproteobacteria bacterium]|nr:hypothetical protein [Deltaproteobacteria bacterium]